MLALYRSGRHADALAVYQEFRRTAATTISASSRRSSCASCRDRILNQDPSLESGAGRDRRRRRRTAQSRARVSRRSAAAHGRRPRRRSRAASRPRRSRAGRRRRASSATATRAWTRGRARSAPIARRGDPRVGGSRRRLARLRHGRVPRRRRRRAGLVRATPTGCSATSTTARSSGWLAFLEGEVALVAHGDAARAAEHAARALDVGRRTGVMDLEMLALSLTGLARVAAGRDQRRHARPRPGDGRRGGRRAVRAAFRRRRLLPHDLCVRARPRRRARRAVVRDGAGLQRASGACRSSSASAAPTTPSRSGSSISAAT